MVVQQKKKQKAMKELCLINKNRYWIKIFKLFDDISKPTPIINTIGIRNDCVYKRCNKQILKDSKVVFIQVDQEDYRQLINKVGRELLFQIDIYKLAFIFNKRIFNW